tara:strand:+ start:1510 stop:2268 length:759 start_codon:yes stop_codon:yes gene_type:complete
MLFSKNLIKKSKIVHCFFSRKNGVSKNCYKSLNCGIGSKDRKINIIKNLSIVSKKIGCKHENIITMKQVHSNKVLYFEENSKIKKRVTCDAILTNKKKICIGILTADCVPILIYDPIKGIIGAIHSGWRGAYKGIIQNTLKKLLILGSKKKNLIIAIGPCISQKNYEVGSKFFDKFLHKNKVNKIFFNKKNHKYFFNLRKYVEYQFKVNRIKNINHINHDTFEDKNNFFSRRRSLFDNQSDYGRNISVIMIN